MRMGTLSMTQVKRKRFTIHNYAKNCGNCGHPLYVDDDILEIHSGSRVVESPYFHREARGCEKAAELKALIIRPNVQNRAVNYG